MYVLTSASTCHLISSMLNIVVCNSNSIWYIVGLLKHSAPGLLLPGSQSWELCSSSASLPSHTIPPGLLPRETAYGGAPVFQYVYCTKVTVGSSVCRPSASSQPTWTCPTRCVHVHELGIVCHEPTLLSHNLRSPLCPDTNHI